MSDSTGLSAAATMSNGKSPKEDVLSLARTRLTSAISATSESRQSELEDLKFAAGSPDNNWQWPDYAIKTRSSQGEAQIAGDRPCLTMNRLPQHIKQITNEQRQNRPSGKVIPADDGADVEMAEIFDGMVRQIEYDSNADVAYDTACDNQVTFGEGFWRITTEYVSEDSFDQKLKIGRIRNSFSVYMDPMIQDPCGEDAEWCFIIEDILKTEYDREYPDATPVSTMLSLGVGDASIAPWLGEDTIRIAEYFCIERTRATLNLYPNNMTAFDGTPGDKTLQQVYGKPLRSRPSDKRKVKWYKINGYEILDEREWAGYHIPVIRALGNEVEVEGRLYVSGQVRNAKDAQRMINYWTSQEAEMLALAPKAPFIGASGQFAGYERQWRTANTTNWPYLEYNPEVHDGSGNTLPPPQRSQPPMAQNGLILAKQGAYEDLKATMGQYNAALGMTSNERSGKAILARQKESDTGTYHYVDNLARAIRYTVRQLVDLIPKIYDTHRIALITGEDGESKMVKIDPMQEEAVRKVSDDEGTVIEKIYNPSVGNYDVRAVTGPGYATKRQETREEMAEILQGNPQLWAVAGDLFVKNLDWPGAQEFAERLRKTIDPKLLENSDENPELQKAQQQMQQMGQEMDQMQEMLVNVSRSMEAREIQIKEFESQVKAYDAETKRISAVAAAMTPEQMQDIVQGTIDAMIESGDLISGHPRMEEPEQPQENA